MANIVLNTKTFLGRGIAAGISSWTNMATGVLAAIASVTAKVRLPLKKEEKAVIDWRLRYPIVADEASACACPGALVDEIDVYIQVRSTQGTSTAARTDVALMVKDLTASSDFQNSVISFTQPTA